jgi:hypothetical protein
LQGGCKTLCPVNSPGEISSIQERRRCKHLLVAALIELASRTTGNKKVQHPKSEHGSSEDLHRVVLQELEALLAHLGQDSVDSEVSNVLNQVERMVAPIHDDLRTRIESLRNHARWDKFTIAFYGETNAGKSTTIETLRILLGEHTKVEVQARFRAFQQQFGLSEAALAALRDSIEQERAHLHVSQTQTRDNLARNDAERQGCEHEVQSLRDQVAAKKRSASLWRKLINLLSKLPEEIALAQASQRLSDAESRHAVERAADEARLAALHDSLQKRTQQQAESLGKLAELNPFADGYIVGTGRSDFTRETAHYVFEANGQQFELLDVPGIEGKEADVISSILGAVQAAHAVFYVTGKAAPPQTGDENGQGTLEKIRAHLGDHTEVWSIYNKRINNPIQLDKDELLSDGERGGITALDETMREHLGEKYRGCLALSAQPAFLAASECLVPDSDLVRNRAKFMTKFSVEEVIAKSGFRRFVDLLTGSMVADSETRIYAANVNKVHSAVKEAEGALASVQEDKVGPLVQACREDWTRVDAQLDLAVGALNQSVQNVTTEAVASFEAKVRDTVYGKISDGIDNDDLKVFLKDVIRSEQSGLEDALKVCVETKLDTFQGEVSNLLSRFSERIRQLEQAYRSAGNRGFRRDLDFDMQFESGVKYAPLVAALLGRLMMMLSASNPAGWVVLAISGLTIVINVFKGLYGLIDSDFKKSQQRKVTNENLDRVVKSMREAVKANCEELRKNIDERIVEIKAEVERSVKQASEVNTALIRVCANLNRFAKKVARPQDGSLAGAKKKAMA